MLKLSLFGGVPVPLNANELLWGLTVNIFAYSEDISTYWSQRRDGRYRSVH